MMLSDSSLLYFLDTDRSTGACIVFYQGGPIDHFTYVPDPVAQSTAEIEYNVSWTSGMAL